MNDNKTELDDLIMTPQQRIKNVRAKCPDAYALTVSEAICIHRLDSLIHTFFNMHYEYKRVEQIEDGDSKRNRIVNVFSDESVAMIKQFFSAKRASLKRAYTISKRVFSRPWFEITGIFNTNPDTAQGEAYLKTSDNNICGRLLLEEYPEFYAIWDVRDESNAQPLREAIGLDSSYLYLCVGERYILQLINDIYKYNSSPFSVDFISIKSTPQTTELATIGTPSLKQASTRYDKENEVFPIISPANHKLYLSNKELLPGRDFEKLDRLLRQINSKVTEAGCKSKVVDISLSEYMELRGLTDKKEARQQYKRDTLNLFLLHADFSTKDVSRQVRFLQERTDIKNSNVRFMLTDAVFESIRDSGSEAMIPRSFFKLKGNAYRIAIYLCDNKKRNVGNANENRVSIAKLLEVSTLPLATDIEPKRYKSHIIDAFFNALDNVEATGELTYKVVKRKGVPLNTVEEFSVHHNYELFVSCSIEVHWSKEPAIYAPIRERKVKSAEAKERGRLKGIEDKARREANGDNKPIKKK